MSWTEFDEFEGSKILPKEALLSFCIITQAVSLGLNFGFLFFSRGYAKR